MDQKNGEYREFFNKWKIQNTIDYIQSELGMLEKLTFKHTTVNQNKLLKEKYGSPIGEVSYVKDDFENVIFITDKDTLKNLQHITGLDKDEECIEYEISLNNKSFISYIRSDRANQLYDDLVKTER